LPTTGLGPLLPGRKPAPHAPAPVSPLPSQDIGHDASDPNTRLYATHEAQPYHNDASDLVSLLCLKNARQGGLSSWSSSISGEPGVGWRRMGAAAAGPQPLGSGPLTGLLPEAGEACRE
jgi:hypothetical protein